MRNKSVFLLLACVCGTIAAIGVSQWMQAQSTGSAKIQMVEIFVTAKAIDVAEEITAEKIRLEQWPADRIPEGSTSDLEDLQGKFARQRFYAGEPVMPVKLMTEANSNSITIPKGFSVVSMKADPATGVANLVRPGDRVDVMAYFTKNDMIPKSMAKTVLRGIRVFAVDGRTQRDDNDENVKAAQTISLLISKDDAEAWTTATEIGKVRLTLGNPGDYKKNSDGELAVDAGDEFLRWLADHQAAQKERIQQQQAEKQQAAAALVQTTPEPSKPDSQPARPKRFKMLKMSGNRLVEYEWIQGQQVPVVVGQTDSEELPAAATPVRDPMFDEPAGTDAPEETESAEQDYSYLNGSQSPFFEPSDESSAGESSPEPVGGDGQRDVDAPPEYEPKQR